MSGSKIDTGIAIIGAAAVGVVSYFLGAFAAKQKQNNVGFGFVDKTRKFPVKNGDTTLWTHRVLMENGVEFQIDTLHINSDNTKMRLTEDGTVLISKSI